MIDPEHEKNKVKTCDYNTALEGKKFCEFRINDLGKKCSKEEKFGYEAGNPCIIVKLNKIFDWVPDTYKTVEDLPDKMPQEVRDIIDNDFTFPNKTVRH